MGDQSSAAPPLSAVWEDRLSEPGWFRVADAKDGFTGRRVRERVTKYVTERENETPKNIAGKYGVGTDALLALNNARFFGGKLKANSRLKKATKLLVPAALNAMDGKERFIEGSVIATNYMLWIIQHDDGDVMELVASEVRDMCWNFRVVHEGWAVSGEHVDTRGEQLPSLLSVPRHSPR